MNDQANKLSEERVTIKEKNLRANRITYKYYPIILYSSFLYMAIGSLLFKDILNTNEKVSEVFSGIGGIIILCGLFMMFVVQYRIWKWIIIRSYQNKLKPSIESPGQAVAYQFLPFFNIYWVYKSIGLIAKNLNLILEKEGSKDRVSKGLNLIILIFLYLGLIPVVGIIPGLINLFILFPIFFINCARVINRNYNSVNKEKEKKTPKTKKEAEKLRKEVKTKKEAEKFIEILSNLLWVFDYKEKYSSKENFSQEVEKYQEEIRGEDIEEQKKWNPDKILINKPKIKLLFEMNWEDPPKDKVKFTLNSSNQKNFTALDLMFQLHNFIADYDLGNHHFFEGLRYDKDNDLYIVNLGS
jgi:hypothetical protein